MNSAIRVPSKHEFIRTRCPHAEITGQPDNVLLSDKSLLPNAKIDAPQLHAIAWRRTTTGRNYLPTRVFAILVQPRTTLFRRR
jgi:hypothetical protein